MKTPFNCCLLTSYFSLKKLEMHLENWLIFSDAKENTNHNAQIFVANLDWKYLDFKNMNHSLNKFTSSSLTGFIYNTLAIKHFASLR